MRIECTYCKKRLIRLRFSTLLVLFPFIPLMVVNFLFAGLTGKSVTLYEHYPRALINKCDSIILFKEERISEYFKKLKKE